MAADFSVNGAGVKAGAAADAAEHFARFFFEDFGSAVVDQDDVNFLWPAVLVLAFGACDESGVHTQRLTCCTSAQ